MSSTSESTCTLLVGFDGQTPTTKELREKIEKGNTTDRIAAVKDMIALTLNGEPQTSLIMSVIKFIQPSGTTTSSHEKTADASIHSLKKLVLYFWEVIDKTDQNGKLLPELILLVDFLRRDLQHPNEYVRGATLRFLCRLGEREILEPLAPAVLDCLEHRHSYVRRNAVCAISNIYQRVPEALPDAAEMVENFLSGESDITAKRNAFLMLYTCAPDRAVSYLRSIMDTDWSQSTTDVFQLAVVELLKQLMQTNPHEKGQYIKIIFTLLQSKSQAVLFQCASTLLALSSSPTAVKAAATTFVNLLNSHGDNNVKLVVVGKLEEIKKSFPDTLQELTMDLLRCVGNAEPEIQKQILELSLDLINQKNVEKVIQFLKKELIKTQAETSGATTATGKNELDYRQMLIKFIHQTTIKHKSVAQQIVPILMDFIIEDSKPAVDIILFIREMVHRNAELRKDVIEKLALQFTTISHVRVFRITLWILGSHAGAEGAENPFEEVMNVVAVLREALQPFPLWAKEQKSDDAGDDVGVSTAGGGATVREDGTYVMAPVVHSDEGDKKKQEQATFRSLITNGDFFLASVLASTMVKLTSTTYGLKISTRQKDEMRGIATELVTELVKLGEHQGMDTDSHERLRLCKQLLNNPESPLLKAYTRTILGAFTEMLAEEDQTKAEIRAAEGGPDEKRFVAFDTPIQFSQLKKQVSKDAALVDLEDVTTAARNQELRGDGIGGTGKGMGTVLQLTGFSDPVYAEATVVVHQFDILLEMLIVNQTKETLQSLTVELATVGDLKLCERPQTFTVPPGDEVRINANLKVSSTETGIIFGNIVYDIAGAANDRNVVVMNDIHIDIFDYVHPSACTPTEFRAMWAEFEWENKIVVSTEIKSLMEYLDHILKHTNMKCQATSSSLAGDADFLSANLFAKSSFGEPVVANMSVQKQPTGAIEGYVRIRSRTQGIALGLGDKITMKQKG